MSFDSMVDVIGVTYMIVEENKIFALITHKLFIQDIIMRNMDMAFIWILLVILY
jgi:hypothetical protein